MADPREELIAAALGNDWEYVRGVGYCHKGNHQQERAVVDKAIRQRVRELCKQQRGALQYGYQESFSDLSGWYHYVLIYADRTLLHIDGTCKADTEAVAWEEALLWLAEKGEGSEQGKPQSI